MLDQYPIKHYTDWPKSNQKKIIYCGISVLLILFAITFFSYYFNQNAE
jgi:hypothetical protein